MKKVFAILLIIILFLSGCRIINEKNNHDDIELTDVEIILYFGDSQAMYVVPEKRIISIKQDVSKEEYLKLIVEELIKGPENDELYPTIPAETKVLNIELEDDLLYLDFSKEMQTKHWGGAAGENMTLLSLANTMTEIEYIGKLIPSVEGAAMNIEHVIVDEPLIREEDKIFNN